jgi:hypothetical protein
MCHLHLHLSQDLQPPLLPSFEHPQPTPIMDQLSRLGSLMLLIALIPFAAALKLDVQAHHGHESSKHERCIRNFVAKDQLVVVTAIVDGNRGDGQQLNMHVRVESLAIAYIVQHC